MSDQLTCHWCGVKDHDVFAFAPAGGKTTCVVCMGLVDTDPAPMRPKATIRVTARIRSAVRGVLPPAFGD